MKLEWGGCRPHLALSLSFGLSLLMKRGCSSCAMHYSGRTSHQCLLAPSACRRCFPTQRCPPGFLGENPRSGLKQQLCPQCQCILGGIASETLTTSFDHAMGLVRNGPQKYTFVNTINSLLYILPHIPHTQGIQEYMFSNLQLILSKCSVFLVC